MTKEFSYTFYKPTELFHNILDCVIISVLNPYCFTLQFEADAVEFNNIQRCINLYYHSRQDIKLVVRPNEISIDLPVVCKNLNSSETDPVWYRSKILNYDPRENTVDLFYVDFGTWEKTVSIHRLRHLVKQFSEYMVFSLTCGLAAVVPSSVDMNRETWSEAVNQQFISILMENKLQVELLAHGSDDCMKVNLFVKDINHQINVAEYLVSQNLAEAISWDSATDATEQTLVRIDISHWRNFCFSIIRFSCPINIVSPIKFFILSLHYTTI